MIGVVRLTLFLSFLLFIGGEAMAFRIDSPAFQDQGEIPKKYTCDGEDLSPPLVWAEPPQGTKSFALIADDPDAPMGTWVHWVVYSIPSASSGLPEGVPKTEILSDGSRQGRTDFGDVGYGGPCPPPGRAHRYFFKLYALDETPTLSPGLTKAELLVAINEHILAQAERVGLYQRGK